MFYKPDTTPSILIGKNHTNHATTPDNKANFYIADIVHTIALKKISSTTAVFEITSTPISVTLNIGETKKIDLDDDNVYDLETKLNAISGLQASVTLRSIKEPAVICPYCVTPSALNFSQSSGLE